MNLSIEDFIEAGYDSLAPAIYPSELGIAYRVTYPKGKRYVRAKLGTVEIPEDTFCGQAFDIVRRAYPEANSFRLFDRSGQVYFCGSF